MKSLYTMVGMKFRGTEAVVAALEPGAELLLMREPANPHDPHAVAIYHDCRRVAYVKGTEAKDLAAQMDRDGTPQITGRFAVGADRWPQVEIDA